MTSALLDSPRLSINEAARRLGVHPSSLWRWILTGARGRKLRTFLVGGRRYILVADLEAFLAAGQEPLDREAKASSPNADRATAAEAALTNRGI